MNTKSLPIVISLGKSWSYVAIVAIILAILDVLIITGMLRQVPNLPWREQAIGVVTAAVVMLFLWLMSSKKISVSDGKKQEDHAEKINHISCIN